jgi:hypothetical protein
VSTSSRGHGVSRGGVCTDPFWQNKAKPENTIISAGVVSRLSLRAPSALRAVVLAEQTRFGRTKPKRRMISNE